MKATLIKEKEGVYSLLDGNRFISTTECKEGTPNKLSIKNCEAIERGYDLDELADEHCNKLYHEGNINWDRYRVHFKLGFQKALEILSDKKFSKEDMINFAEYCKGDLMKTKDLFNEYQSLQQTEFDVELVMGCCGNYSAPCKYNCEYGQKPKLDAEGNLILKRI